MKKPKPIKRHPETIAWDEWATSRGKGCLDFDTLTRGPYLENRLHRAFAAGWEAAKREVRKA